MSARREKQLRQQERITGVSKEEKTGLSTFQKVTITVVAAIVVLFAAAVILINSGLIQRFVTAVKIGDEKISVAEYSFYYQNTVNSLVSSYQQMGYDVSQMGLDLTKPFNQQEYTDGSTWDSQFKTQTNATLQKVFGYYQEAKAAGYELTQEEVDSIDEQLKTLEDSVKQNGSNLNAYLKSTYGKGADRGSVRDFMLRSLLAESYSNHLTEQLNYSEEELQKYYDEHKKEIDVVDYRAFMIDGANKTEHPEDYEYAEGEEEKEKEEALQAAKDRADEALGKLTTLTNFNDVAKEYCDEEDREQYSDPDGSKYTNAQYSSLVSALGDWLFDDARRQGDKTVVESGTNIIVVMFDQRYREEYNLVDVRHILIAPEDGSKLATVDDAAKAELKQKAEDVLNEWKAGEKTEESFAALAEEYSSDSPEGGLYENVYQGQMVANFNDWIFDESRKTGDTDIVETEYGYHVMYFVGPGDISWKADVENFLVKQAVSDREKEMNEKNAITTEEFGLSMIGG